MTTPVSVRCRCILATTITYGLTLGPMLWLMYGLTVGFMDEFAPKLTDGLLLGLLGGLTVGLLASGDPIHRCPLLATHSRVRVAAGTAMFSIMNFRWELAGFVRRGPHMVHGD